MPMRGVVTIAAAGRPPAAALQPKGDAGAIEEVHARPRSIPNAT